MTTESSQLVAIVERLRSAGCVSAEEEARDLLAAASDPATIESWLMRRERGEPLAWITGTTEFCGQRIGVDPGVYVPRQQTADLARRAAALLPDAGRAIDLCTGAGAIAVHLMASDPSATVIGIDCDEHAARCARRNGVPALVGDLAEPLRTWCGIDVVTAVAPYVPSAAMQFLPADVQRYEPRVALDGGDDGLMLVRRVIDAASRLLRPGGWLLIEVGGDHDVGLDQTLSGTGFENVESWRDEDDDLRGIAAQLA